MWVQVAAMTADKEYFQKYFQVHKKEYRRRYIQWNKDNPEAAKAISKRYREKKRKKSINKSDYGKIPLEELYIRGYGKSLRKTKDDVTHIRHKKRMFCVDCLDYKTRECPGWDRCKYKEEIW